MEVSLMTPFGLPINKVIKSGVSGDGVSLEEFRAYQQEVAKALANKTSLYLHTMVWEPEEGKILTTYAVSKDQTVYADGDALLSAFFKNNVIGFFDEKKRSALVYPTENGLRFFCTGIDNNTLFEFQDIAKTTRVISDNVVLF